MAVAGRPRVGDFAILRRSRVMMTSRRLWRPRLVFWAGALAIGLISVAFARAADAAHRLFQHLTAGSGGGPYLPLVLTPAGFVLCAWLAARFFPNAQGSGIPQAMAARHLRTADALDRLLSLRIVAGKVVLTVLGLACGASIGREGPTVQVGAAIMLAAGRAGGMARAPGLILAGSAAGIAAAFNTPLAGIVFAIEEMARGYDSRTNGLVLSAVIVAGLASLGIVGNYTYFGVSQETAALSDWSLVLACGVVGGAFGAFFSQVAIRVTRRLRRWQAAHHRALWTVLLIAGVAGLVAALAGVATGGATFGTGYEHARDAIEGTPPAATYFLAKLAATLAATLSGIPGGLFAPSLAVGAGLGSTLALAFGGNVGLAAVLGMAGYFSGVVQAPMTAFVIILEMTGNHDNVVPLMLAAVLGYGTARLIAPEPLYHALSRLIVADDLRRQRAAEAHPAA